MLISLGYGAIPVMFATRGVSHVASLSQMKLIRNFGSQRVVLEIFCVGPAGNLA